MAVETFEEQLDGFLARPNQQRKEPRQPHSWLSESPSPDTWKDKTWQCLPWTASSPSTSTWTPGVLRRLPWTGILSLIIAVVASAMMAHVLIVSNGQPIDSWKYQPTVHLAIASTIANVALHYALRQGVTIAWWVKAMEHDTRLRDLHDIWSFGNSFWDIVCAGRRFNLVALAGLVVALVPVNGPLLQRASVIEEQVVVENKALTIPIAQYFPAHFTGLISGRGHVTGHITSNFSTILRDSSAHQPINITKSGCKGLCKGRILGAGYEFTCVNNAFPDKARFEDGALYFATTFKYDEDEKGNINYTSILRSVCQNKTLSEDDCIMRPATIEYLIQLMNDTIELDPKGSVKTDRTISYRHVVPNIDNFGGSTHGGMHLALHSRFNSSQRMHWAGAVGYQTDTLGTAALEYQSHNQSGDCDNSWNDPTLDMLSTARELAFRTALFAAAHNIPYEDDTKPGTKIYQLDYEAQDPAEYLQRIEVEQTSTRIVYRSHFLFLGIAVAFTFCTTCCITLIYLGYSSLGRDVSLSPIEIATAFAAPALPSSVDSNADIGTLLKQVGEIKVTYGTVWPLQADMHKSKAKLMFAGSGQCGKPQDGQAFEG